MRLSQSFIGKVYASARLAVRRGKLHYNHSDRVEIRIRYAIARIRESHLQPFFPVWSG